MRKSFVSFLLNQSKFLHNCQPNVHSTSSKVIAVAVRQKLGGVKAFSARAPAGLFAKTCLCATLLPFPVVQAWSVWKKDGISADPAVERFAKTLKLKNPSEMTTAEKETLIHTMYRADDLYKNGEISDYKEIHALLYEHRDKKEPELQWRLARITYELAKKAENRAERGKMLEGAFQLVTSALEIDDANFAVHKWFAILLNEVSVLKGLKEQIIQSVNVKKHISRAVELDPLDPTAHYMLGHWCFSVAEVSWVERKFAATIFASPPESTYTEALEHFLKAERIRPDFYSKNHLMLAKTYIRLGEVNKAAKHLRSLENLRVRTDDDLIAKTEGLGLIKKYFKTRKDFYDALRTAGELVAEIETQ